MKYAILLFVSCVPLCYVTVRSLVDPPAEPSGNNSAGTAVQQDELGLISKSLDAVSAARKRGDADGAVAAYLAATDLLDVKADAAPPLAESASLVAVLQEYQNRQEVLTFLDRAKDLPLAALTWKDLHVADPRTREAFQSWADEAERRRRVLAEFLKAARRPMISPRIAAFLDAMEKQKTEFEEEQAVPQAVMKALDLFATDPAKCRTILDAIRLTQIRSAEQRDSVKDIIGQMRTNAGLHVGADQLKARWGDDWTADPATMEPDKVERQFQDIRELLDQYPAATKTYGELAARRDLLADRMKKITAQRAFAAKLAKLGEAKNLAEAEQAAAAIVRDCPNLTPDLRRLGREKIAEWLTTRVFLRREPPAKLLDREIEETTTNNQQRKIGVFFLPPDGLYYYFWKWDGRRDRQETPGGEEKLENTIKRDRPQYVRWAEEYNRNVKAIREGVGRERWEAFLQLCRTMQKELDEYRKHWGTQEEPDRSCSDWMFLPDPEVLPAENVKELCGRLERLQQVFDIVPH